ncbi:quinon protein alcohol dehydrogenase-like superfamily [Helicostylum pulchrum]|nr:quinon protein alcohol dehydrogenase-like superfamily [Helicostylum pulchrum]
MPLWNKEKDGDDKSGLPESTLFATDKFSRTDLLICASNGSIYAIHKQDGTKLWKAKIGSSAAVISLFVTDSDKLVAGGFGKTHCIDLMTGNIIWTNKMPGFGYSEVSVATTPSKILYPSTVVPTVESSEILPPHYDQVTEDKQIIISCSEGKAMAIDLESGETRWTYNCPGGWYNIPVTIIEPSNWEAGRPHQLVYVGSGKWVYCLNASSGHVIWSVQVSNATFSSDYMTLATPWSSRLAAESHSAFSQNPSGQAMSMQRARERSS